MLLSDAICQAAEQVEVYKGGRQYFSGTCWKTSMCSASIGLIRFW